MDNLFPVSQPAAAQAVEATNEELITLILEDCERYRGTGKALLDVGREGGKKLLRLKRRMAHGEWQSFLAKQFPFSMRTAQRWMREAKNDEPKNDTVSFLESSLESYMETTCDENPAARCAVASELSQDLPALRDDRIYYARTANGGFVEIIPVPHAPGYHYLAVYPELLGNDKEVLYTRRGFRLGAAEVWKEWKKLHEVTLVSEWIEESLRDGVPWYVAADRLAAARRKKLHDLLIQDTELDRSMSEQKQKAEPLSEAEQKRKAELEELVEKELTELRKLASDELTQALAQAEDEMDPEIHRVLTRMLLPGPTLAERAARIKAMMADMEESLKECDRQKHELMEAWEADPPSQEERAHFEKLCKLSDWLHSNKGTEIEDNELRELITLVMERKEHHE